MSNQDQNPKEWYAALPKKRMGTGALIFDADNRLLLVKPSYKDHWSIPGGVVDQNESPRIACLREIKEEVGLELSEVRLLCIDYVSAVQEKDENLQFIFYGGVLTTSEILKIKLNQSELSEHKFVEVSEALSKVSKKLSKRLPKCLIALKDSTAVYLEDGEVIFHA